jgi:hypothetical protein
VTYCVLTGYLRRLSESPLQATDRQIVHVLSICDKRKPRPTIKEWHDLGKCHKNKGCPQRASVLYMTYSQLAHQWRGFKQGKSDATEVMRQLHDAGMLIADEAHTIRNPSTLVRPTQRIAPPFLGILRSRHQHIRFPSHVPS